MCYNTSCNSLPFVTSHTMENNYPLKKDEFLEAFRAHSDALFRYCFFKIGDREKALDLTQDAFMKTWNYLSEGNDIQNMRAFLYRTASNLVIDEYRRRKPQFSLETLQEETGFEPSSGGVESIVNSLDGAQAIELMKFLPEPYGEVLLMRFVDELSLTEISVITGQSENTIAVQVHRGIAKLKKLFNHD